MKALSIAVLGALLFCGGIAMRGSAPSTGQQSARSDAAQADTAIRELQQRLAEQPGWTEGWWNLGTTAYDANRFDIAKQALTRVVEATPQMGIAWNLLGLSEFEMKDYIDALTHLQRAASLGNTEDEEVQRVAAYHLGLLLIRDGEFERASELLQRTFAAAPNPQVTFALGLAMLRAPVLPVDVDVSREALVNAAGALVAQRQAGLSQFPAFVSLYPEVPFVHYAFGLALEKAGRDQEALRAMQAEAAVSPESPLPWLAMERLEARLGRGERAKTDKEKEATLSGKTKAATEDARMRSFYAGSAASGGGADDAATWRGAMQAYASGQYATAVAALKPWLKAHPEDGTAWAVLGLSEFRLGDEGDALLHLERGDALGLKGSVESVREVRYTEAVLLIRAGTFDRAMGVLASEAKVFPNDPQIRYALGMALLRRAVLPASDPGPAALVNGAGQIAVLLEDSRYDDAFALFKPLLQQYPGAPFLHYAYGTALMALSEFDEAEAQMRAEEAISPGSELPYVRLASIALRQHRPGEAIGPAKRALALAPTSPDAHYLLGRAALESGDDGTAMRELQEASKLSPGSPEIHFNLAKAYARAQMTDAAAKERATFARLNELAEGQKNGSGQQIYSGPRESGSVTDAAAATH